MSQKPIRSHRELEVYQMAFEAAMQIFQLSKSFPVEEKYSETVLKVESVVNSGLEAPPPAPQRGEKSQIPPSGGLGGPLERLLKQLLTDRSNSALITLGLR